MHEWKLLTSDSRSTLFSPHSRHVVKLTASDRVIEAGVVGALAAGLRSWTSASTSPSDCVTAGTLASGGISAAMGLLRSFGDVR